MVESVSGKKRLLVGFQGESYKVLILNQLTNLTLEMIPNTKEAELYRISVIPGDIVDSDKGCYNSVYVLLQF